MTKDLGLPEATIRQQIDSLEKIVVQMTQLKDSLPEGSSRDQLAGEITKLKSIAKDMRDAMDLLI